MDSSELYVAVHWTARLSAVLFALALIVPLFARVRFRPLYVGFLVAHTTHFALVTRLALGSPGAPLFPGGRSLTDVGGPPAMLGIFAFFYVLAGISLLARAVDRQVGPGLRRASRLALAALGLMFVGTYLPLVERSPWYAVPAVLVATAVAVDAFSDNLRRLRCIAVPGREA